MVLPVFPTACNWVDDDGILVARVVALLDLRQPYDGVLSREAATHFEESRRGYNCVSDMVGVMGLLDDIMA